MPICTIDNPHFEDFMNPKEAPTAATNGLIGLIRKIRQASLNAYFINKLNTTLRRRAGYKIGSILLRQTVSFLAERPQD